MLHVGHGHAVQCCRGTVTILGKPAVECAVGDFFQGMTGGGVRVRSMLAVAEAKEACGRRLKLGLQNDSDNHDSILCRE